MRVWSSIQGQTEVMETLARLTVTVVVVAVGAAVEAAEADAAEAAVGEADVAAVVPAVLSCRPWPESWQRLRVQLMRHVKCRETISGCSEERSTSCVCSWNVLA